ncbi:MAG: hypothetical protein RBS33_12405 [Lentimicrobium sp.]|nr:hypothetical protein [Lentimicrobium sp.]
MKKVSSLKWISINLLFILAFTSCGETECPAFPEESTGWFPYAVGNIIKFTENSDSHNFKVIQFEKTGFYSFSNRCDCECESSMSFKTEMNSLDLLTIKGSINYGNSINLNNLPPIDIEFTIYKQENELLIPLQQDKFYCDEYSDWEYQDSSLIDSAIYYNVLTIKNLNNLRFNELIIVKNIGILQIKDSESNIWKFTIED